MRTDLGIKRRESTIKIQLLFFPFIDATVVVVVVLVIVFGRLRCTGDTGEHPESHERCKPRRCLKPHPQLATQEKVVLVCCGDQADSLRKIRRLISGITNFDATHRIGRLPDSTQCFVIVALLLSITGTGCSTRVDEASSEEQSIRNTTEKPERSVMADILETDQIVETVEVSELEPKISEGTIFLPDFVLRSNETSGGVIFAAQTIGDERPVLISAMHLLGPSTGMQKQLTVEEISTDWLAITAYDVVSKEQSAFSGIGLGLPGASAVYESSPTGDVMAFVPQSDESLNAMPLESEDPQPGDILWLPSPCLTNEALKHRAICEGVVPKGFLAYLFDDEIQISGTSGAPVVNQQGKVVAVHRGGGLIDGEVFGLGTQVSKFLPKLQKALQRLESP